MEKVYKDCQSCDMPLNKDVNGGGTNKDGTKSTMYCSKCYKDGEFLHPEIDSAHKMQTFVKQELKKKGFPQFIASLFVMRIPILDRWKDKHL